MRFFQITNPLGRDQEEIEKFDIAAAVPFSSLLNSVVLLWKYWAVTVTCYIWLNVQNVAIYIDLFDSVPLEPGPTVYIIHD